MTNLKRNNLYNYFFIYLIIISTGCQTTQDFKLQTIVADEVVLIETKPNRIQHECYFLNAEKENNWRYQYMMYILNEKNDVIPIMYPTNQDRDQCFKHLHLVEKILKINSTIRICSQGIMSLSQDAQVIEEPHDFGKFGKFKSNYDALTFNTFCNSQECIRLKDTWTYECPD